MIPEKLLKPYDPKGTEERIYKMWEESGFFKPEAGADLRGRDTDERGIFSMVMPPPNVTGTLHMGHAETVAIEDIMVRYKRMRGFKTLWIPGTDHAAIATQSKVEKIIYKEEGKTRHDLGREEFLKRVEKFAQDSHDTIVSQIKKLGASCDWSREAYTLDEKRSLAVQTAFKKMHEAGLIYRGNRVINWDPKGQTTVSDDEVVYKTERGKLYTFRYSRDFPISISTTRPETKVGDTAVAVHPNDARYKKFVGQEYDVEFAGAKLHIKVVADEAVDPEFGTGAVGVTPAHSATDFEIAERHKLPMKVVINELAKMTDDTGSLVTGMKVKDAREKIVAWLRENNLLEKEEDVEVNLATAERSGGVIEPLPKLQWFVKVESFKKYMREVVESGKIEIIPDHFKKTYYHWIDNLRDWCISRQIWFGHRIPIESETDTLDTWFSSGLWTFSTLGWPFDSAQGKPNDLKTYHPTSVLETGRDILFFWVARMILMSKILVNDIPFHKVYLHGLVRDEGGKKMSKSSGNIIDPLDMIEKFGADAVRMSLIVGTTPGTDSRISEDKIKAYKHFANKLWNIARFTIERSRTDADVTLTDADKGYIKELDELTKDVTSDLENFRFYLAAEKLYHYVWHRFADVIIEDVKKRNDASGNYTINHILQTTLKLLHPFMPFITEEIWGMINSDKPLIIESWPQT